MSTVPGYQLTIRCFIPADPNRPREMAQAAALVDSLPEHLAAIGLKGATVEPRFVQRHRVPPSPPAPPQIPGEPPQPLDHAPAGPAAAGASEEGGDAPSPQQIPSTQSGQDCRTRASNDAPAAGNGGGGCSHQRMKTYGSGQVVCLDCQGVIGGEAE